MRLLAGRRCQSRRFPGDDHGPGAVRCELVRGHLGHHRAWRSWSWTYESAASGRNEPPWLGMSDEGSRRLTEFGEP